jgi:HK97 family phage prohead protease
MPDLSARAERPADLQRRNVPFKGVELRAAPDGTGGDSLTFGGYACVTEVGYEMQDWLGPYTEVVRAGSFAKTLSENADVPFLVNHGGLTLARTKSGTMQLAEDDTGLHVEAKLDPASPHVAALRSAMDRGDVDEMSFAFWVTRQQWSPDYDQRDILEVNLNKGDVSVVNYGANPSTAGAQLNARELTGYLERLGEDERRSVFERLAAQFETPTVVLATRAQQIAWAQTRAAELREGATLSADTLSTLQEVLDLVASADTSVDEAQVVLSDLMGVPNPDDEPDDDAAQENGADLDFYERRARALALQSTP